MLRTGPGTELGKNTEEQKSIESLYKAQCLITILFIRKTLSKKNILHYTYSMFFTGRQKNFMTWNVWHFFTLFGSFWYLAFKLTNKYFSPKLRSVEKCPIFKYKWYIFGLNFMHFIGLSRYFAWWMKRYQIKRLV